MVAVVAVVAAVSAAVAVVVVVGLWWWWYEWQMVVVMKGKQRAVLLQGGPVEHSGMLESAEWPGSKGRTWLHTEAGRAAPSIPAML